MGNAMFCKKCGKVCWMYFKKRCNYCGTKMNLLSEDLKYKYHLYVEDWGKLSYEEMDSRIESFVIGELINNPLFSLEDYKKQSQNEIQSSKELDEFHKKQLEEQRLKILNKNLKTIQKEQDKQNCVPKCPTCGSTNVEKISIGKKAVGGAMFGVLSSEIRNTMHCNNCGAKW